MTSTTHAPTHHETGHGDAPRRRGLLMRPGWVRAAWVTPAFFFIGMYLVVTFRWIMGWDPVYDWEIIVLIAGMVTAPIGFLLGLGTFDYWLYWISGRPTLVDDHANHGAYRWTDYFKVNTDHKVIGIQYLVTTFVFFIVGGFLAMLFRAELAEPGMQFFTTQTFNGLVSAHATLMITTLLIAVPTGIKVFSWLATLWEGKLHLNTPMLFALGFISTFVIGGLSGIYLAAVPIDIHASDTYFIVAHIHYVLFGGSVFTIFAGLYYWFPKMTGRMYDERLGKLHFWLTFVAFNATFFPMHWVGLDGMPRRVADYAGTYGAINMVISIFSFILGASVVVFVYNMITSWARGPIAGSNPWRAMTIEWQVSSPPPVFNFDEIPQVVGSPYEYGVPGAKHVVLKGGALQETPA